MLLANYGFVNDAHSASSGKGMPGVRVIGTTIACESTVAEDIRSGIDAALDDIIAALTRPLTAEEKSPKMKTEPEPRIAFKGNYRDVNHFYYRKGWTDGLPILPPTEKAVAEMLTGTDLPRDHVVAKIIPRMGKATVEKIAVNAVMAGALPTHMPVLIAAVDALSDPKTRYDTFQVSTGSWAPFLLINGPIRNDIHVNSGSGALSPGNMANAVIGRAVGLIAKNIGGARKGIEDMGTMGNPAKYTLVLGENEEASAWPPLHVDMGFDKSDNVLTVFFPNQYNQTIPAETHAASIAEALAGMAPSSLAALLVIPDHAGIFAREGWSKQQLKDFIVKNAPKASVSQRSGRLRDEDFIIVVAGGPGVWMARLQSSGGFGNEFVTRKIELPRNWDNLKAKYRTLVPTHVKY
ncbi:MAG TPA: hypothetical protein VLL97_08220 [Acidobacteriota bacterium]|nr:hypothetical protein [Acidobacteriota bacterium]